MSVPPCLQLGSAACPIPRLPSVGDQCTAPSPLAWSGARGSITAAARVSSAARAGCAAAPCPCRADKSGGCAQGHMGHQSMAERGTAARTPLALNRPWHHLHGVGDGTPARLTASCDGWICVALGLGGGGGSGWVGAEAGPGVGTSLCPLLVVPVTTPLPPSRWVMGGWGDISVGASHVHVHMQPVVLGTPGRVMLGEVGKGSWLHSGSGSATGHPPGQRRGYWVQLCPLLVPLPGCSDPAPPRPTTSTQPAPPTPHGCLQPLPLLRCVPQGMLARWRCPCPVWWRWTWATRPCSPAVSSSSQTATSPTSTGLM